VRHQIAFYASTPAYRGVLEAEGWGELQPRLQAMTREGRWLEMASLISDEMVERIAVVGEPAEVARELQRRYADVATRIAFASPFPLDPRSEAAILAAYRALEAAG
jgi:alkanesulfonate monooxygenase SsuD/methylene tetrahydromethanopterin reductase-like flavin-dependent oxidoreductase (luciferase family)